MTFTTQNVSHEPRQQSMVPNAASTAKRRAVYGKHGRPLTGGQVEGDAISARRIVATADQFDFDEDRGLLSPNTVDSMSAFNASRADIRGEIEESLEIARPNKRLRTKPAEVQDSLARVNADLEPATGVTALCNESKTNETRSTPAKRNEVDEFNVPDSEPEENGVGRHIAQRQRPSVLKRRPIQRMSRTSPKSQLRDSHRNDQVSGVASLEVIPKRDFAASTTLSSSRSSGHPPGGSQSETKSVTNVIKNDNSVRKAVRQRSSIEHSKLSAKPSLNRNLFSSQPYSKGSQAIAESVTMAQPFAHTTQQDRWQNTLPTSKDEQKSLTPASLGIALSNIEFTDQSDDSSDELGASQPTDQIETPRRHKLKDRLMSQTPLRKHSNAFEGDSDSNSDYESSVNSGDLHPVTSNRSSHKGAPSIFVNNHKTSTAMNDLAVPTPGRGKVTYGGQRSHLTDQITQSDPLLDQPIDDFAEIRSANRRKLEFVEGTVETSTGQALWSSDSDRDGPDKPLRNVHELRAAGKMRRVALETDALLEDIFSSNTKSLKRGSMIRLASKLAEVEFRSNFVRDGLHSRFYALAELRVDVCFDAAFCIGAMTLLPVIPATDLLSGNSAACLFDKFVRMLTQKSPLIPMIRGRSANISRIQQEDFRQLLVNHNDRSEWQGSHKAEPNLLTSRSLSLECLAVGVKRLRYVGYKKTVLDVSTIAELAAIGSESSKRTDPDCSISLDSVLATSTLEALSVAKLVESDPGGDLPIAVLSDISTILLIAIQPPSTLRLFASLAIRICLNITTASSQNGRYLSKLEVIVAVTRYISTEFRQIKKEERVEQQDSIIDNLILSLGLLTNMTEELDQTRLLFIQTTVDHKSCVDDLLSIFQERYDGVLSASTENETKVNVVFGYLAVLLCCLCLTDDIRAKVSTELQDASLSKVRNAVAQFILIHQTVGMELDTDGSALEGRQSSFVERMEKTLSKLTSKIVETK